MSYKDKIEEIKESASKHKSKGLSVAFTDDCWHVSCKGTEDSGHLSMDIKLIENKMNVVSRGAIKPRIIGEGKFKGAMSAGSM